MKTRMMMLALAGMAGFAATGMAMTVGGRLFSHKPAAEAKITGDYVEARTASVMAGPCHYNGELVTTGRDALLAWSFSGGSYNGVSLAGVKAMAAVTSTDNLGETDGTRTTELAVDPSATDAQVAALEGLLEIKCAGQLGKIVNLRREPVVFTHGANGYTVNAGDFAVMVVDYRADDSCCTQPNLVWYAPLTPLDHRKVGYTEIAAFDGGAGGAADRWQREGEDSAFYGAFSY